jgi:hypothetical protein
MKPFKTQNKKFNLNSQPIFSADELPQSTIHHHTFFSFITPYLQHLPLPEGRAEIFLELPQL